MRQLANYLELMWRRGTLAAELRARGVGTNPDINLVPKPGGCVRINGGPCLDAAGGVAIVQLSAAQLLTAFSAPIVLLPAPGAGNILVPTRIDWLGRYNGIIGYEQTFTLYLDLAQPLGFMMAEGAALPGSSSVEAHQGDWPDFGAIMRGAADDFTTWQDRWFSTPIIFPTASGDPDVMYNAAALVNQPLMLAANEDLDEAGAPNATSIATPGAGYAVGDTLGDQTPDSGLRVTVNTVDGGGGVLTYTVTNPGHGAYEVGNVTTLVGIAPQPGAGDGNFGLTVDSTMPPNTTITARVFYSMFATLP